MPGGVAIASPFRSDVLRGKRCLVTGGTSGIGFEIARQLGLHGATITVMGRREPVAASASAALRAEGNDVPFGFVTSESTAEQFAAGIGAGAAFLLSKPFTAEDLAANLGAIL